jgi:hypothetical protein
MHQHLSHQRVGRIEKIIRWIVKRAPLKPKIIGIAMALGGAAGWFIAEFDLGTRWGMVILALIISPTVAIVVRSNEKGKR